MTKFNVELTISVEMAEETRFDARVVAIDLIRDVLDQNGVPHDIRSIEVREIVEGGKEQMSDTCKCYYCVDCKAYCDDCICKLLPERCVTRKKEEG
jgi:hypothetical protein